VLRHLAKAPTRVISHDSLVEHVCRRIPNGEDAIDTHISRLRRKLYSVPTCDVTLAAIPGAGYALLPPAHRS
jgi:DNA-binding response OmpR family regulator